MQEVKETDYPKRVDFCNEILNFIAERNTFLDNLIMSDEATFHLNGKVNRHNFRIWGSENPRVFKEHVRDSPKITVWCGLSRSRIYTPFFFANPIVTAAHYVDMLEQLFLSTN